LLSSSPSIGRGGQGVRARLAAMRSNYDHVSVKVSQPDQPAIRSEKERFGVITARLLLNVHGRNLYTGRPRSSISSKTCTFPLLPDPR
jgi:hypothetical protein